ncbi:MAG: hypothetical protein AB7S26_18480 [Sandaracinaceae bacterium]
MAETAAKPGKSSKRDDALDVEDAPPPKPKAVGGQPHIVLRIVLGTAGLSLVIGFFLPWLQLGEGAAVSGMQTVSGMDLVINTNPVIRALVDDDIQRYLLLLVPGFGLALTAVGFLGVRYSGHIAAVLGLLIVLYGVITVIVFFFQKTGVGLWLILVGSILAVAAGTFAWARARSAPKG